MPIKIFKHVSGGFLGADKDSIKRLSKIRVGEIVEVEPVRREVKMRRSTKQNAYYWGVVLETLRHSLPEGYEKDDLHDALKRACFGFKKVMGIDIPAKKTSELNTEEMEQYLKWIRDWAAQIRGIYIPKPNECGFDY